MDPNTEKLTQIMRNVYDALSGYKQIYDEKRNNPFKPTWTYF
jgi:hypothetical protein